MKIRITQEIATSGYHFREGSTVEVPDQIAELILAKGCGEAAKETTTRKTRAKKAVKPDADSSDVHE